MREAMKDKGLLSASEHPVRRLQRLDFYAGFCRPSGIVSRGGWQRHHKLEADNSVVIPPRKMKQALERTSFPKRNVNFVLVA